VRKCAPDLLEKFRALVLDAPPRRPPANGKLPANCFRGPGCRSILWFGQHYAFTDTQGCIVEMLWDAWEKGTPDVSQVTLLEKAGSETKRLSKLFHRNKAWRVLIVAGKTRGTFRLQPPS
jgi:hypothetical protein